MSKNLIVIKKHVSLRFYKRKMVKKQTYKSNAVTTKDNKTEVKVLNYTEIDRLFNKMISDLYHDSVSLRRKPEISPQTLSMRFGNDY